MPADQLADGGLGDVELAERGQDVADVGQEGPVRPDHDHPAPPDLFLVRVQQVRDPVQSDGGLPGARRALHADRLVGAGADDVILVRLDGRDDVPHGPRPRPLDLLDEDLARPGSGSMDRTVRAASPGPAACASGEELIFVGSQLAAGEPEAPAQREVHRVRGAGSVERPGHRRPPVDHGGRAVRRVHVPAADVKAVARDIVVPGSATAGPVQFRIFQFRNFQMRAFQFRNFQMRAFRFRAFRFRAGLRSRDGRRTAGCRGCLSGLRPGGTGRP